MKKLMNLKEYGDKPSVLIAHTIKGKGVSFIENDYTSHGKPLSPDLKTKAVEEIKCA